MASRTSTFCRLRCRPWFGQGYEVPGVYKVEGLDAFTSGFWCLGPTSYEVALNDVDALHDFETFGLLISCQPGLSVFALFLQQLFSRQLCKGQVLSYQFPRSCPFDLLSGSVL